MKTTESYRKLCLEQQTALRSALLHPDPYDRAIQLFMNQHALLHASEIDPASPWSFEDEIFDGISEAQVRAIPRNGEHSIAWILWHIARCEDITMNLLIAGSPQVLHQDHRLEQMRVTVRDTGNAMDEESIAAFSRAIDIEALRAYRLAVGRRTREIVSQLRPEELKKKVDPARLQRITEEGAVVEAARWLIDYWGKRNFAELLLMPATRHPIVHFNEALKIKKQQNPHF